MRQKISTKIMVTNSQGFTLVEMLVSAVILATAMSAVALLQNTGSRSLNTQALSTSLNALIDQDLARIQALDRQFSCCTGNPCTADQAAIAASSSCRDSSGNSTSPGGNSFYSPRVLDSQQQVRPDTAEMAAFRTACSNGGIASGLSSLLPSVSAPSSPATLNRAVAVADPASNLLQLTYNGSISGNTVITRVVNLIPTAAAWCP
jgi:prepilin-type N-terminal cleavage/methylation domain-containing protein